MKRAEAFTPIPKTPKAKKAPRRLRRTHGNTVPTDTITQLAHRAGFVCEARTEDCWGSPEHPHHRAAKGPHGPDHDLSNLLAVCGGCHSGIHARPRWARRHGLILGRGDDPELLIPGCSYDCDKDHRTGGKP